jgi:hypothetical protein
LGSGRQAEKVIRDSAKAKSLTVVIPLLVLRTAVLKLISTDVTNRFASVGTRSATLISPHAISIDIRAVSYSVNRHTARQECLSSGLSRRVHRERAEIEFC